MPTLKASRDEIIIQGSTASKFHTLPETNALEMWAWPLPLVVLGCPAWGPPWFHGTEGVSPAMWVPVHIHCAPDLTQRIINHFISQAIRYYSHLHFWSNIKISPFKPYPLTSSFYAKACHSLKACREMSCKTFHCLKGVHISVPTARLQTQINSTCKSITYW